MCSFKLLFRAPGVGESFIPGSTELSVRRICQDNLVMTTVLVAHTADDSALGGFPKVAGDRKASLEQRGGARTTTRLFAASLTPAILALVPVHWHKWACGASSIDQEYGGEVVADSHLSLGCSTRRFLLTPVGDFARFLHKMQDDLLSHAAGMGRVALFPFRNPNQSHAVYFVASMRVLDSVGLDARVDSACAGGDDEAVRDIAGSPVAAALSPVGMRQMQATGDGGGSADSRGSIKTMFHAQLLAVGGPRRSALAYGLKSSTVSPRTTSERSSGAWWQIYAYSRVRGNFLHVPKTPRRRFTCNPLDARSCGLGAWERLRHGVGRHQK